MTLVHNDLLYLCVRINPAKENIPNKLGLAIANTEHTYQTPLFDRVLISCVRQKAKGFFFAVRQTNDFGQT